MRKRFAANEIVDRTGLLITCLVLIITVIRRWLVYYSFFVIFNIFYRVHAPTERTWRTSLPFLRTRPSTILVDFSIMTLLKVSNIWFSMSYTGSLERQRKCFKNQPFSKFISRNKTRFFYKCLEYFSFQFWLNIGC